jgi:hypothetical protein
MVRVCSRVKALDFVRVEDADLAALDPKALTTLQPMRKSLTFC